MGGFRNFSPLTAYVDTALSLRERVSEDGAFISRRRTCEGFFRDVARQPNSKLQKPKDLQFEIS